MLTRLRQLTLDRRLVPSNYLSDLQAELDQDISNSEAAHAVRVVITPKERLHLQQKLFQIVEDNEECPICFDALREARITVCGHAYCLECITAVLSRDPKCPLVSPERDFPTELAKMISRPPYFRIVERLPSKISLSRFHQPKQLKFKSVSTRMTKLKKTTTRQTPTQPRSTSSFLFSV